MSNLSTFLGGSLPKAQAFTSNGTFTKPSNVAWVTALLVGGGGGGYSYPAPGYPTGGAGGETKLIPLYLTTCSTIAIGTGGVGGGAPSPVVNTAGGNTTATGATPVTATAYGGGKGTAFTGSKGGGTGGGGFGTTFGEWHCPSNPTIPFTASFLQTSPQTQDGQSSGFGVGGGGGAFSTPPYAYGINPCGTLTTIRCFPAGNALGAGSPTGGGGSFGSGGNTANTGGGGNYGVAGGSGYAIIYYMG